jgi:hypothetical protein
MPCGWAGIDPDAAIEHLLAGAGLQSLAADMLSDPGIASESARLVGPARRNGGKFATQWRIIRHIQTPYDSGLAAHLAGHRA